MKRLQRIIIVLAILMSGLALAPRVALPYEHFSWQRYAAVYQPPLQVIYLPIIDNRVSATP